MERYPPIFTLHLTTPTHNGYQLQQQSPTQTYTMTPNNSPTQGDKYTTLCIIFQAGVAALDNLDITNQEEIPKDVISLIHTISQKLINYTLIHNTKTIDDQIDNLSQKIETLTKAIPLL
jgi:hypothetical protein